MWVEIIFYNFVSFRSVKSFQYNRFIQTACLSTKNRVLFFAENWILTAEAEAEGSAMKCLREGEVAGMYGRLREVLTVKPCVGIPDLLAAR